MGNTSHQTLYILLVMLFISSIKGNVICQPGGLVTSAIYKSEIIESYYQLILDDLLVMNYYLHEKDSKGDILPFDWNQDSDSIFRDIGFIRYTDQVGNIYWGDRRPDRKINSFLPSYYPSGSIIRFTNETTPELVNAPISTNETCHFQGYQPYFCRNQSLFNNSMLNYDISLNVALKNTILSVRESKSQYISVFSYTVRGSFVSSTTQDLDIGYSFGGNFAWPGFGRPFLASDEDKKTGLFGDPFIDIASNTATISAFRPVYFGDYFWGTVGIDISMNETRKLISEYEPTKSAFSMLVNEDGFVVLTSERAVNVLYNKSLNDFQVLKIDTPKLGDLFSRAKLSSEAGIEQINLDDVPYYVAYQRLRTLDNWVFFVFAPSSELKYEVTFNATSFEGYTKFNDSLIFGITLRNQGSLGIKYNITTPEWLFPIENGSVIRSNVSASSPGNTVKEFDYIFFGVNSGHYDGFISFYVEDNESSLCYFQEFEIETSIYVGPELKHVKLDEYVSIAIFISCMISLLVPFCLIVFIAFHQKKPAINKISPHFTIVTMFGMLIFQASPIFLTNEAPYCMAWWWLCTTGFVIFFGSLIVKAFRIERIFHLADRFKKAKNLTNRKIFPFVFILLALQIILLIAWNILTPLELIEYTEGSTAKTMCGPTNPPTAVIFFSIQCVYAALFIFFGCYFSFKTRNVIRKDFREAKEMMFAVYNFSILVIIIAGLAAANTLDPNGFTLAVGIGTIIASIGSSFMLLGKRVYMVLTNQRDSSSDSSTSASKNVEFNMPENMAATSV